MKEKVVELLKEAKDYISGEEMSKLLGVSRTAVWKHIKKLKEEGFDILSVTNKGYKLAGTPDCYNATVLKENKGIKALFDEVLIYPTIDSTNKQAKRIAVDGGYSTALLIANEQTLGVGRRGRSWVSENGTGIFMSFLLRPNIKPIHAAMLTLVAGFSVCQAIRTCTELPCKIKWPNDLVIGNKKICGILTEMSSEMDTIQYVVVGIGINVSNQLFDDELKEVASSLLLESGKQYERQAIVMAVIEAFEENYRRFIVEESLAFMKDAYNLMCVTVGKTVKLEQAGKVMIGKALSVSEDGSLVILKEDGETMCVNSGEVSVRGLYGYVD